MQHALIRGRGGGSCIGSSTNVSMSTASNADNNGVGCLTEQDYIGISEISSYSSGALMVQREEDAMGLRDTELNLGLSLNTLSESPAGEDCSSRRNGRSKRTGRILTARDLPNMVPSLGFRGRRMHGESADADSVQEVTSVPSNNQVVGWPPIRAYRMNSLVNQSRVPTADDANSNMSRNNFGGMGKTKGRQEKVVPGHGKSMFVKVNMDGVPIGRKVDLNTHSCYESLANALEEMFKRRTTNGILPVFALENEHGVIGEGKSSKLLDGNSEFVLTYEDKEGDWMLVGDVPWDMFLSTVRRLRIMRTCEVNGLGARFEARSNK
ncbi:auxin-responsive protein IAA13-like [Nymphaea colorata]|nr:auxin-responsive protein IAA13-like [Nymphaea colorata]